MPLILVGLVFPTGNAHFIVTKDRSCRSDQPLELIAGMSHRLILLRRRYAVGWRMQLDVHPGGLVFPMGTPQLRRSSMDRPVSQTNPDRLIAGMPHRFIRRRYAVRAAPGGEPQVYRSIRP